jgi:hypothetical protein
MLDLWERGLSATPVERALTLVATAYGEPVDAVAQLSVGQRDARLLMLRDRTFGSEMISVVSCPMCNERLEFNFSTADLDFGALSVSRDVLSLSVDGYDLRFRLPNSVDLIAINDSADARDARQQLLERCVATSTYEGDDVAVRDLPAEVVAAVTDRMAQSDPQGDVELAVACSHCHHEWRAGFDIASFFWTEINAWAHRILKEVHALASAYGWREADILTMSAWRRQYYLNCIAR